jgi:hypothetical protein
MTTPSKASQRMVPADQPECPCAACDPGLVLPGDSPIWFPSRMNVCPDCGNKRCPKAANHAVWQCSGSNETGQAGVPVARPAAPTAPATPPVGAGTSEGATGPQIGAGELGLGDALRAYDPNWRIHPQIRDIADRADALERERDEALEKGVRLAAEYLRNEMEEPWGMRFASHLEAHSAGIAPEARA